MPCTSFSYVLLRLNLQESTSDQHRRFPVDFAKAGIDANFIFVKLNERLGF